MLTNNPASQPSTEDLVQQQVENLLSRIPRDLAALLPKQSDEKLLRQYVLDAIWGDFSNIDKFAQGMEYIGLGVNLIFKSKLVDFNKLNQQGENHQKEEVHRAPDDLASGKQEDTSQIPVSSSSSSTTSEQDESIVSSDTIDINAWLKYINEQAFEETRKVLVDCMIDVFNMSLLLEKHLSTEDNENESSNQIVFCTSYPDKTLGDVFFAAKLMNLMKKHEPSLQFHWYIQSHEGPLPIEIDVPEGTTINFVKNYDEIGNYDVDYFNLIQAREIFCAPTFHYLSKRPLSFLKRFSSNVTGISEYNCVEDLEKFPFYNQVYLTGFPGKKQTYGLLLESTQDISVSESKQYEPKLFDLMFKPTADSKLPDSQLENIYHENSTLFFSYFSKDRKSVMNDNHVSGYQYCRYALKCALSEGKSTVDIFTRVEDNLTDDNILRNILRGYRRSGSIRVYQKIDTKFKETKKFDISSRGSKDSAKIQVRIIDPFPMDPIAFQYWLRSSHPLNGLTGDQSLIEGITMGHLVVYQCMNWKYELFRAFVGTVKQGLPEQALLTQFYEMQLRLVENPKDRGKTKFIDLYIQHKQTLESQAQELASYINANCSLEEQLIPELLSRINMNTAYLPTPARLLFPQPTRVLEMADSADATYDDQEQARVKKKHKPS